MFLSWDHLFPVLPPYSLVLRYVKLSLTRLFSALSSPLPTLPQSRCVLDSEAFLKATSALTRFVCSPNLS